MLTLPTQASQDGLKPHALGHGLEDAEAHKSWDEVRMLHVQGQAVAVLEALGADVARLGEGPGLERQGPVRHDHVGALHPCTQACQMPSPAQSVPHSMQCFAQKLQGQLAFSRCNSALC